MHIRSDRSYHKSILLICKFTCDLCDPFAKRLVTVEVEVDGFQQDGLDLSR